MGQATNQLKLSELEGKWFVIQSNFPMWLKGDKINPSFNYSLRTKNDEICLLDEVIYTKNNKTKQIVGYDKPLDKSNTSFVWRGKGLLCLLKSKWDILYLNEEQHWMIIHFEKTLFTPEGVDVISKSKKMDPDTEKEVLQKLLEIGIDQKLTRINQQ